MRRWLRLGPTRAELIAEAELWQARCEKRSAEKTEADARVKEQRMDPTVVAKLRKMASEG